MKRFHKSLVCSISCAYINRSGHCVNRTSYYLVRHENERYFFLILLSSMGRIFCYTELIHPISLRSVPEWEFLYYSERNFLT